MRYMTGQLPVARVSLSPNTIHIWRAWLCQGVDFAASVLSGEELQRGNRFLREEDRRRFCLARAFLRLILAHYLPVRPMQIQFRTGPHGKLYLADNPIPLQFNLSHSKELALYAVTLHQEVGIDVEWINPERPILPLAARFFTPAQSQSISALSDQEQLAAFYHLWTRKEAYLKALGVGLSGLSHLLPEDDTMCVTSLALAPQYAGAVALVGENSPVSVEICHFEISY